MRNQYSIYSIILFIGISLGVNAQVWTAIGDTIFGQDGNYLGSAVDISADGLIVAVGSYGNNKVAVYEYTIIAEDTTWVETGNFEGAEGDLFGTSVSLSLDGTVVAVGAPGGTTGYVKVYQFGGGSWTEMGTSIGGEADGDRFGNSVSLSGDGSVVAVGAYKNDGNGNLAGHVRVFDFNGSIWTQIGSDIDGEAAEDWSGHSVSTNQDGSIVAIGAFGNDGNGIDAGHVRVFQNISNNWIQMGDDLEGANPGDNFGFSVNLNNSGSVLAVGASSNDEMGNNAGQVKIFQNNGGGWVQIGEDLFGDAASDQFGSAVSLNGDGSLLAVSAFKNDSLAVNNGQIQVFENLEGIWTQIGQDIHGTGQSNDYFGYSVNIAADSTVLIGGAIMNIATSGYAMVYDLLYPPIITVVPENQYNICEGDTAIFSLEAELVDSLRWQYHTLLDSTWVNLYESDLFLGVETTSLSVVTGILDSTFYRCLLYNIDGITRTERFIMTFDALKPEIICPGPLYVEADSTGIYTVNSSEFNLVEEAIDNCQIDSVWNNITSIEPLAGLEFLVDSTYNIIWHAIDMEGNVEGCSFTVTVLEYNEDGVGELEDLGVSLFPNPTKGEIKIDFEEGKEYDVLLYNALGQLVYSKNSIRSKEILDITSLDKGVYVVGILAEGRFFTSKIIKE